MAALAILDDIGAIFVIAFFYTKTVDVTLLFIASFLVILLALINYAGFRKPIPYLIIGTVIWGLTEAAGIHGTIAGIAVAFTIPARPKRGPKQFLKRTKRLLKRFEERKLKNPFILRDTKQHIVLEELKNITEQATTPLQRWESALQLPVSLLVLPIFALVNAGTPFSSTLLENTLINPVSLGILLGLAVGKPLGIILLSRVSL